MTHVSGNYSEGAENGLSPKRFTGPLAGIRVIALAGKGPGPVVGMLLADMGAHVVRVVRPPNRPGRREIPSGTLNEDRDLVNRGVDTVVIDLKDAQGLSDLIRLVRTSDVFIEGYRPGVVERLGIDPDVALRANGALIYARLTGYGQTGPLAHAVGHDINYVAQSGALHAMARSGEAPRPPINLLGDYAGGAAIAAFGIVSALYERATSGRGQVIDASMVDGVALLTTKLQGLRAAGLFSDEPGTNWIDSGAPFYDTYRCADGRYIAVGALEPDFYDEFVSRLGVDVVDWPSQENREEWSRLRELISSAVAARTQAEWAEIYRATDSCVTPVMTFDEAANDPHNVERGLYQYVGGALHPSPAPRLGRTPAHSPSAPRSEAIDFTYLIKSWETEALLGTTSHINANSERNTHA